MATPKPSRPPVLIESWLPVAELGAESQRERGASSALPPLYFLHVWWARRPLTASRAAILASLLPPDVSKKWFLKTLGIFGDPVAARKRIAEEKAKGIKTSTDKYGYARSFTYTPDDAALQEIFSKISDHWNSSDIWVLDPMAGGGSIPFEAMRYGLTTFANELNPVAYVVLKATLEYPARFGEAFVQDIRRYAGMVGERASKDLSQFYPRGKGEEVSAYLWARTVRCPACGLIVPLSPNWWLQKGSHPIAVRPVVGSKGNECTFELLEGTALEGHDPDDGTVARGTSKCPRTGCCEPLDSEYIKGEAQQGRMGHQLYAVVVKTSKGKGFRLPTSRDLEAIALAETELERQLAVWAANGLVPDGEIPPGHKTDEPRRSGISRWTDLFCPRQLLAHLTYLRCIMAVKDEARRDLGEEKGGAVAAYLSAVLDKCTSYNNVQVRWHVPRGILAGMFDRHDFSFKWSYAEALPTVFQWDWASDQIADAYRGIAALTARSRTLFDQSRALRLRLNQGDAAGTTIVEPGSCHLICVDPPYYDNVMYAELSDFFYVWQKRILGDVFPEAFQTELTDKDAEAVANPARFRGLKGKRDLADQDYETKMRACFENMHRQLRDDGVLTVMFTHKRVDAWDTLAAALIGAGFEMTASWPIHTESEHSLHQARKNAAASTILLVCRKREPSGDAVWWEDLIPEVQRVARAKAEEFEAAGITGVDLYISTFGPVLQVLSAHWPVKDRKGDEVRPDVALDEARRVVTQYRHEKLCKSHSASLPIDAPTLWAIQAWDIYQAARFPYDEARRLSISIGAEADVDLLKKKHIVRKKGKYIELLAPGERRRKGQVDPNADTFPIFLDAIHTACLLAAEDGMAAVRKFLARTGLHKDESFVAAVEALLNALPAAIAHPGVEEKQRRGEWYLRDIAQHILSGRVEVPTYEQLELGFE